MIFRAADAAYDPARRCSWQPPSLSHWTAPKQLGELSSWNEESREWYGCTRCFVNWWLSSGKLDSNRLGYWESFRILAQCINTLCNLIWRVMPMKIWNRSVFHAFYDVLLSPSCLFYIRHNESRLATCSNGTVRIFTKHPIIAYFSSSSQNWITE